MKLLVSLLFISSLAFSQDDLRRLENKIAAAEPHPYPQTQTQGDLKPRTQGDLERLENLKKTLEEDVIPYLLSYERKLLKKLYFLVSNHLDCCTDNHRGTVFVKVKKWDRFSSSGWDSKVYFSTSTPLLTLKKALSLSKLPDGTQITPPIKVPEIRKLLNRIEAVRAKREKLESYMEEIVFVVTNLKTASALKSSRLSQLKKKARDLILKVEKDLATIR